jgi:hypothetical protein
MFRGAAVLALATLLTLTAAAGFADDRSQGLTVCGEQGASQGPLDLGQAADWPTSRRADASMQGCVDPTLEQEAGGCCAAHGAPAGCDAPGHGLLCADGKTSRSCGC